MKYLGKKFRQLLMHEPFPEIFSKPVLRYWIEDYTHPDDFIDGIFEHYDIVNALHHEAWYKTDIFDALSFILAYSKDYSDYGDWHSESDMASLIHCCLRDIYVVEVLEEAKNVYKECLKEYREHGDYDKAYLVIGKHFDDKGKTN